LGEKGKKGKRGKGEDKPLTLSRFALSPFGLFPHSLNRLAFIAVFCLWLAGPAAAEIKIGLYLPMTGPAAAMGGDSYFLLTAAMDQAGGADGAQVAQALAATKDFAGVTGVMSMGPNHNPIKGVTVIKVENGQFVYQTTINP